jgi:hypothetical protein
MKLKLSRVLTAAVLSVLISGAQAQQCNVSSLNSAADVERAQRCIKSLQEDFERLLENYKVVLKEIDEDLFSLLAQEANCIVIEKSRRTNPAITQTMVRDCERLSKEYAIKWSQAGSNFQKLIQTQDLTKEHIEALKLKFKQLEGVVSQFRTK